MPDRYLRERAVELIRKESRYTFPPWIRGVLIGFAVGLIVGTFWCATLHPHDSDQDPEVDLLKYQLSPPRHGG